MKINQIDSSRFWKRQSLVNRAGSLLICLGVGLISTGCQKATDDPSQNASSPAGAVPADKVLADKEPASQATAETGAASDASTIQPVDEAPAPVQTQADVLSIKMASWDEVQKIASSTGKVTVLDVWSTVCAPCIKELPGLVKLQKEYEEQVRCMTVDIDFDGRKSKPPATYEEDVATILKSIGAVFPNFISTTPSDDVYAAAQIDSIPAVFVFDADGKLVKKFVDAGAEAGFGYEKDVAPFVKSLLQK